MGTGDWAAEYEQLPSRTFATRLPEDSEPRLRALAAAFKATGMPHSGAMYAAGVAGIMLAELTAAGWVMINQPEPIDQADAERGSVSSVSRPEAAGVNRD